ncbi:MAG: DUF5005 domain-containing protein [Chitinophagales bacterium]
MKNLLLLFSVLFLFSCEKEFIPNDEHDGIDETMLDMTTISTKPANQFNFFFTRYGNGWTGGDATYSIKLPDGRNLWTFGDTFMDTVYADRSRPSSPLIRNSFVIQDGLAFDDFHTMIIGDPDAPEAIVNTPDPEDHWYWPGDATAVDDILYMYMMYFHSTGGGGGFGFAYERTDLVKFSLPNITEISRETVWDEDPDNLFGAAVMEDGGFLYIYGSESTAFLKYCHVARVPLTNVDSDWEFFNALTGLWQSTYPGVNGRLKKNPSGNVDVSAQFSVFYEAGKYRLVTQEGLLGHNIYTYEATTPTGPWGGRKKIYTTNEGADVWTYNAFMHNDIKNAAGYMLMSYNLNAMDFADLFSDADTYRPKFVWVKYN